jgi:hypothetical protein
MVRDARIAVALAVVVPRVERIRRIHVQAERWFREREPVGERHWQSGQTGIHERARVIRRNRALLDIDPWGDLRRDPEVVRAQVVCRWRIAEWAVGVLRCEEVADEEDASTTRRGHIGRRIEHEALRVGGDVDRWREWEARRRSRNRRRQHLDRWVELIVCVGREHVLAAELERDVLRRRSDRDDVAVVQESPSNGLVLAR